MNKFFGTDGIRGIANKYPITPEMCVKIAISAGISLLSKSSKKHRVIIAKDTRLSGYLIETALTSGFISIGMDVMLLGPIPTPAVSMLVKSMKADLGIMISASHNSYEYNGIKFFGSDGNKLSVNDEEEIEKRIINNDLSVNSQEIGKCYRIDGAGERYIEFVKSTVAKDVNFENLKVVIDSANGASYKIASTVLWELGCDVISINDSPNGSNINERCGATYPKSIQAKVLSSSANIGIALDGDSDRVIMCDEFGNVINGDKIIAIIATYMKKQEKISNNTVVVTDISDSNMEKYLKSLGLHVVRTKVGDKYVVAKMIELKSNVGGEQSGHIILGDYNNTGDGLVAALQILYIMLKTKKTLYELSLCYTPSLQFTNNIKINVSKEVLNADVLGKIESIKLLYPEYRILVRKSGTEPLVRILIEGNSDEKFNEINLKLSSLLM